MPILTLFAGINGAGKSTLYNFQSLGKNNLGDRVCPDEILKENNGDWRKGADIYASGKIALEKIKSHIKDKQSFNWEFTLITAFVLDQIKAAKSAGFQVNLNFISVDNLETSIHRIKKRMLKGGHGIPDEVVEQRFKMQYMNLANAVKLVDSAVFYENAKHLKVVGVCFDKCVEFFGNKKPWQVELIQQLKTDKTPK
jgi:predicted ABC-type ATPase